MGKGTEMAKKKAGALATAVEVAATTAAVAATVYKAVQAHREGEAGAKRRDGSHGQAAPGVADAGPGQALVGRTPPPDGEAPAALATAPDAASSGKLGGVGGALGVAGAVVGVAKALLDLNAAPPDALRGLRKIGRKRAKRIVAHRPFVRVKDLKRVLPKRVYKAVRHQLTV